ncbi:unnamed protein product [Notodromas monacha]|uniref:Purine nucleoside phosphorylase n=1 Tax=Notodromas monacha TaxID=399045 RepID=A0A7R9G819_9CRUS|nr:unnamed protein product [Notodromas monacha]CAG0912651.1 unnamed protein product [Notodromas monacha]
MSSESTDNLNSYEKMQEIADFILGQTEIRPRIGIICGSGLSGIGDLLSEKRTIPYTEIPHFPKCKVSGHRGELSLGLLEGVPVVCFQGRCHYYEGFGMSEVVLATRIMKLLGAKIMIVTNAAGGLNPSMKVGDMMIIKDHLNFLGLSGISPLRGSNEDRLGPRFPSLTDLYDGGIRQIARAVAVSMNIQHEVHEGILAALGGPSYETVAELKFLRLAGVDAVGMSTVHEAIAARHCGMLVFGCSLITNECIVEYGTNREPNHEEVIEASKNGANKFATFISKLVSGLRQQDTIA